MSPARTSRSAADDAPRGGEQQRRPPVRPRRRRCGPGPAAPGTPAAVAAATSTLFGSPRRSQRPGGAGRTAGPAHWSALDDHDGGASRRRPARPAARRCRCAGAVVDPGVDHQVGQLAQQVQSRAPHGGRNENSGAGFGHGSVISSRTSARRRGAASHRVQVRARVRLSAGWSGWGATPPGGDVARPGRRGSCVPSWFIPTVPERP